MRIYFFLTTLLCLSLNSCSPKQRLTAVHIVDANGFSQTVSQSQRLEKLESVNFLTPQPYQKVLRTWKVRSGQKRSVLTSYYPSGRIMQYLEGTESKASGIYREWYENGQLRVEVNVTSGKLDFGNFAENSWSFDGVSHAYDEKGNIQAEIPYAHGLKEGIGKFYHSNGNLWQEVPYKGDKIEGSFFSWYADGTLFIEANYQQGLAHGVSKRFWPTEGEEKIGRLQSHEEYESGKLIQGRYFDKAGNLLAEVKSGLGQRLIFGKSSPSQVQTIVDGVIQGFVGEYDEKGMIIHQMHVKNGMKEGEETYYYPTPSQSRLGTLQPKIKLQWSKNLLHGVVRTWYENGQLQSERQIVQDENDGPYLSYYPNGQVRMVEEYSRGNLVSGDYFELGGKEPLSSVRSGSGKALIFDDKGNLEREIIYTSGQPTPLVPSVDGKLDHP